MAKYRRVYPRLWDSVEFRSLTPDQKLLCFNVLTGPQSNRVGCFVYRLALASEETGIESVNILLDILCDRLSWEYDSTSRILWIPSWFGWNPPESRDALKGYISDLTELPKTQTVNSLYNNLCDSLLEYDRIKAQRQGSKEIPERFSIIWADLYNKSRQPVGQPVPHQEHSHSQSQEHSFFVPAMPKRKKNQPIESEPQEITPALRAWALVVKLLNGQSLSAGETIDTPEIQAAITAAGGSPYLSKMDVKFLPSVKRDFIAAYNEAREKPNES